jgi:rhamnosyltransferase
MISVAIPTLNGAPVLERTLAAVREQTIEVELVVLDSHSTDDTRSIAEHFGAAVHTIDDFGHGRARNRLMELTSGERVAFLTQDAVPADGSWLAALLAPGAPLTYGPYEAPGDAPAMLRREYTELFADPPDTWISSANLCLARSAWERTPFRDVPYAEDQQLRRDLGDAVYVPEAAVVHGHEYTSTQRLRRSFDEWRALHELYGWTAPLSPRVMAGTVRVEARRDRAFGAGYGEAVRWHSARVLGAALGTRADRLPATLRSRLSLERRA